LQSELHAPRKSNLLDLDKQPVQIRIHLPVPYTPSYNVQTSFVQVSRVTNPTSPVYLVAISSPTSGFTSQHILYISEFSLILISF